MGSYFGARWAVTRWLPHYSQWFLAGLLLFLIAAPGAYYFLEQHWRHTNELPYLFWPADFLLPWSLYPALLLVSLAALPRYGVWAFGNTTSATVAAVRLTPAFDNIAQVMPSTCIDFNYEINEDRYFRSACAGGQAAAAAVPGESQPIGYLPLAPQWAVLQLAPLYRSLDVLIVWWASVVIGWLVGAVVLSQRRYPPPPPQPPRTASELLDRFNLNSVLTEADDPELWQAVLHTHFPMPEDERLFVPGLRFGIGELRPASRYMLQPISGTCFVRVDRHHLARLAPPAGELGDHHFDPDLDPILEMRLIHIGRPPRPKRPTLSIVVPRPSRDAAKLPVYLAVNRPGAAATGATYFWVRGADGSWTKSDERVNGWYEG